MSSRLCNWCRAIPLDPGLETLERSHFSTKWDLGIFGEIRRRDCPFCELIVSICSTAWTSWDVHSLPDDSVSVHVQYLGQGTLHAFPSRTGSHVCIAGSVTSPLLTSARVEFPEWIDFVEVQKWISNCESTHETDFGCVVPTFDLAMLPNSNGRRLQFRLIDTQAQCIVYAPQHCRYIALSYVWGQSVQKRLILTTDNEASLMKTGVLGLPEIHSSLPNTIQDAMAVVQKLGERYLWVDSLCLVQDDTTDLLKCVTVMDLIYEMASLTIVAGSGIDAWSGLPGVAPTPRQVDNIVRDIKEGLKMTTVSSLDGVLRNSIYSTRAWTMQEEILSSRMLVFVDCQVYFHCPVGLYSEAMNWPGQRLQLTAHTGSLYSTIFSDYEAGFSDFSIMISYYTTRSIGFQNDILRAAQGMLRKYSLLSGYECFEGLPAPMDRSILFEWASQSVSKISGRRSEFPSYSWTGWKGAVQYDTDLENPQDVTKDRFIYENVVSLETDSPLQGWIIWHSVLKDGSFVHVDEKGLLSDKLFLKVEYTQSNARESFHKIPVVDRDTDFGLTRTRLYPHLLFWTICVTLRLQKLSSENAHFPHFDVVGQKGHKCGTADMEVTTSTATEAEFALVLQHGTTFWALALKWKDGMAERCGIARLSLEAVETWLLPDLRWKAIVLG